MLNQIVYDMPHHHNAGYFPVSGRARLMSIDDVIDFASGYIWSENTMRARDFLGYAIPQQDERIAAMIQASRAQRQRRIAEARMQPKQRHSGASWRHAMRPDRRKKTR